MFSQNGLYSQKTPQEQMMQQRQEAFFGTTANAAAPQNQNGAQMMPPPQPPQVGGMGTNPFGNAAGSYLCSYDTTICFIDFDLVCSSVCPILLGQNSRIEVNVI